MTIRRGNLIVMAKNSGQYRDLTEVTGSLAINTGAKLYAPALAAYGIEKFQEAVK